MLAETICSAVSAAGLGIAAVTAYRRRFLAAARIAAYALVPVALVLTGFVEWVAGMVFAPSVWIGFGLLGVAWVLLLTTRAVERRALGLPAKQKEPKAAGDVPAGRPSPPTPPLPPSPQVPGPVRRRSGPPPRRTTSPTSRRSSRSTASDGL